MKAQNYGRIVMTSSSSGLYGNFGQANYGAAKMALVGLMNVLVLEGAKYDIRVNSLAPVAGTAMTRGLLPDEVFDLLTPESVTAALLVLCHQHAPNRSILCAGAGAYASAHLRETEGIYLPPHDQNPEAIVKHWAELDERSTGRELASGLEQTEKLIGRALSHKHSGA
jgi:hypothetical protein